MSALGLGLIAFTGLCATAPGASEATLRCCSLTALARNSARRPSGDVIDVLIYAGMSRAPGPGRDAAANSLGCTRTAAGVLVPAQSRSTMMMNITQIRTSQPASYAAYRRIAALGHPP